mmetsp:Transcript_12784/g.38356  ORF Transcript_12784/g.38356 Transcript_12784/m.38356 type:complete len:397 (-) Transcript_12784:67-1257(-)|eukprot:CAMPEP_0118871422 /NCGR_PEP_ID=MMETSP1163-20130328/14009_1 /TAXON_ID=124430 /ORGANISM="Phaeomonas parva, Strain CCMP2877" /LENGTH=396 /DNA_ID=CAMNT_0006806519 /DNA_START=172 /DNA_END=1362 /DNA_ORIENTATION=-
MSFRHVDAARYWQGLPPELLQTLETPQLVVFMDVVRHNVNAMIHQCGGDAARWRPHLKTTKMAPVWRELLAAGVRHAKCATLREAELFLRVASDEGCVGDVDLLVAYPLVGPAIARLAKLKETYPTATLSMLVEEVAAVDDVVAACKDLPAPLGVWIDVNAGMDRTGVPVAQHARIAEVAARAGVALRGVHYYEGHIHGDASDEAIRKQAYTCYDTLFELLAHLRAVVPSLPTPLGVITSGTPGFPHALGYAGFSTAAAAERSIVHQISPGTVVFHDVRSQQYVPAVGLEPAALVLSRCVSKPREGRATFDVGSKSIAAEAGSPVVTFLGYEDSLDALKPSEEHLPVKTTGGEVARGDLRLLCPLHVCPTVNLAEKALIVEGNLEPRFVEVEARAH